MAECPAEITRLVEQFGRNIDSYRESRYKEAQLRKEFIDPFFEILRLKGVLLQRLTKSPLNLVC